MGYVDYSPVLYTVCIECVMLKKYRDESWRLLPADFPFDELTR